MRPVVRSPLRTPGPGVRAVLRALHTAGGTLRALRVRRASGPASPSSPIRNEVKGGSSADAQSVVAGLAPLVAAREAPGSQALAPVAAPVVAEEEAAGARENVVDAFDRWGLPLAAATALLVAGATSVEAAAALPRQELLWPQRPRRHLARRARTSA